jgi:HK97 family phage portal protein
MPSVRSLKSFSITRPGIQFSGETGQLSHDALSTHAGTRITEKGALRIAAAWIANTIIADEVASLPLKLVRKGPLVRAPEQPAELAPLWDRPNPDQVLFTFFGSMSLSMTLAGCAYAMLGWQNNGSLSVIWPLDPTACHLTRDTDSGGLRLSVAGQGELVNAPGMRPEFLMAPLYQLAGQLEPVSPVKYAAELLGLSAAYDATAARLMGRGFNPSALLSADEDIPPVEAIEISSRLSSLHGGGNSGGVAVIGGKNVKLQPWTMSMADAEFMAQHDAVFNTVMALWRVPPTVAGMVDKPSTWGTGVAEFSRGLERFTLRPIVLRLQAAIEAFILRWVDPDLQARFKFDAMLAAAPKDRADVQRQNLMSGITSVERVLAQNDEPPFEDGETVFSQLALATDEDRRLQRLKVAAEAFRALVAAGVSPEDAATATGFDPSAFTPRTPVNG